MTFSCPCKRRSASGFYNSPQKLKNKGKKIPSVENVERSFSFVYTLPMVMNKIAITTVLFLILVPGMVMGENYCVRYHEALNEPSYKEYYQEWKSSVHFRSGISCEYCHNGNSEQTKKEDAHQGVYGSLNPQSSVFYLNIPALCGGCHKTQFDEFTTSRHYRDFVTKGVGPNCVTCHDAMSTKVIKAQEIEIFCSVCHNSETGLLPGVTSDAKAVMERIELTGKKMLQIETTLEEAEKKGIHAGKAKGFFSLAQKEFFAGKQDWHAFKMNRVASRLQGVEMLLQKGRKALEEQPK